MSKFKVGQKVTIKENFYAPVNGYIVRVETGLGKNDLSVSFGIADYISRCERFDRYDVAYEQKGFQSRVERRKDLKEEDIQIGWHGMKSNGDPAEFKKFGVKVPGYDE